jgi:hypothetical protein
MQLIVVNRVQYVATLPQLAMTAGPDMSAPKPVRGFLTGGTIVAVVGSVSIRDWRSGVLTCGIIVVLVAITWLTAMFGGSEARKQARELILLLFGYGPDPQDRTGTPQDTSRERLSVSSIEEVPEAGDGTPPTRETLPIDGDPESGLTS